MAITNLLSTIIPFAAVALAVISAIVAMGRGKLNREFFARNRELNRSHQGIFDPDQGVLILGRPAARPTRRRASATACAGGERLTPPRICRRSKSSAARRIPVASATTPPIRLSVPVLSAIS